MASENDIILSVGVPEVLALTGRTNPTPYGIIIRGIDYLIADKTQGGIDGWLKELDQLDAKFVVLGPTTGRVKPKIEKWLSAKYEKLKIGNWNVYKKRREQLAN